MAAVSAHGTAWQDGVRHALEYAIAASLALHALALLSLPSLPSLSSLRPAPPEPPLEARLMPRQPVAVQPPPPPAPVLEQAPPPPKPLPAPRPVVKKAPPKPKRVHRTAPKRVREPVREISVPAPVPAPAPPLPEPPAPEPIIAAPAPAPAPPAAPVVRAAPPLDTVSLVAQYRSAIIAQAKRYKRYPRFARDNGWEGKVNVRMEIAADGSIESLRVARGTGYSILDQQALEMLRRAKPEASIPDGLRGKAFGIDVPVIFSLRDAEG